MEIIDTGIEGLALLKPMVFKDERGYFIEAYKESFIKKHFPGLNFIQDNESKSSFGVLRGLHFQKPPFDQTKLVRVIQGKILDVVVDLRINSKSFKQVKSFELSSKNKNQLLIPKGFAHGFITLSKQAIFSYKVDNIYSPIHESGIVFDDAELNINWIVDKEKIILSKEDKNLSKLKHLVNPF